VTKSRNVSIVVSGDAKNRSGCKGKILSTPVYYSEHSECMNLDVDFYFSATCGIDAIKNDCNSGKDWYVMGCKVEECWVEKLDEKCKLQFSSGIIPIIAAQPKRDMQQYEGRKAREEIQEHRKKPELLKAAWSLVDKASEGRNLLRTEKEKLESGLHGSEAITTALSGRLQIPSSGTKSGGGFPGFHKDMNNQDVELGFFALPDTMHRAKVQAPVSSRVDTLLEIHIAASNITRT
jgi:hypothetical protein